MQIPKQLLLVTFSGVILATLSSTLWGQSSNSSWEEFNQAGTDASEREQYDQAEKNWVEALKIAEGFGSDDLRLATSLNSLAGLYFYQEKYVAAEPLYKRALPILEKGLGVNHSEVIATAHHLAVAYHAQKKHVEAEPLYKRVLASDESDLNSVGEGYLDEGPRLWEVFAAHVATDLNELAELYIAQAKYAEAEPLFRKALPIMEKALGPEHPGIVPFLERYTVLLRKMGRDDEAIKIEARANSIRTKPAP
jgi:tetratricopeptide (TPR) repeat protein